MWKLLILLVEVIWSSHELLLASCGWSLLLLLPIRSRIVILALMNKMRALPHPQLLLLLCELLLIQLRLSRQTDLNVLSVLSLGLNLLLWALLGRLVVELVVIDLHLVQNVDVVLGWI